MVYKNCKLCDESIVDIEVIDGKIVNVASSISSKEFIDMKQKYLLPKIVDLHVGLLDHTLSANTIKKVAKKAIQGGVGHIVLTPFTNPPIDNEVVLEFTQNTIKDISDIKIDIAINALLEDLSLSNIAILLKKGAIVPFMSTIAKNNIAMRVAEYVKMYKTTLFCKAEDNSLISTGVMFEGDVSSKLGLAGIPELSEVVHVSRMIEIARYYNIAILFKAIASPRSLEMIQQAQKEGVAVAAEVSLHHLIFDDSACENFNTIAKINPPLVSKELQQQLLQALKDDKIEVLTLLHQANSPVNKEVAFFDASYGMSSIAFSYGLYYTKLVKTKIISMDKLIKLIVQNPLKQLQLPPKEVCVGANIKDFIILDIEKSYKLKHSNSLYNEEEIFGVVEQICN